MFIHGAGGRTLRIDEPIVNVIGVGPNLAGRGVRRSFLVSVCVVGIRPVLADESWLFAPVVYAALLPLASQLYAVVPSVLT